SCCASATSISSGCSAVSARIFTRSGSTSTKPHATKNLWSPDVPPCSLTSPAPSSDSSGACPYSASRYPDIDGSSTASAVASSSSLSGVTSRTFNNPALFPTSAIASNQPASLYSQLTTTNSQLPLRR